jgi:hypothetical protein
MLNKWLGASFALCVIGQCWAERIGNKNFPKEEYEQYMELIGELDPDMHLTLKQCELDLGGTCIDRALAGEKDRVVFGTEETDGYPILVMHSIMDRSLDAQKKHLKMLMGYYNKHIKNMVHPMATKERQKLLHGLKAIDLALYDAIIKVDPTGENHIKRSYDGGSWTSVSTDDGLPLFHFDPSLVNDPYGEMLFVLAHELSHYILGHFYEDYTIVHRELSKEDAPQEFKIKGKKVAGKLPFKETFKKSRDRVEETEADRMAVIDFGINIDDALCWLEKGIKNRPLLKLSFPAQNYISLL